MTFEESWALIKACPLYYERDPEENQEGRHFILMNDVWGWAWADEFEINDENICEVAKLYDSYGFCGLLYYQSKERKSSEFTDNNRIIQFVQNEERIKKEEPNHNKRAYYKASYIIDGNIEGDKK